MHVSNSINSSQLQLYLFGLILLVVSALSGFFTFNCRITIIITTSTS